MNQRYTDTTKIILGMRLVAKHEPDAFVTAGDRMIFCGGQQSFDNMVEGERRAMTMYGWWWDSLAGSWALST